MVEFPKTYASSFWLVEVYSWSESLKMVEHSQIGMLGFLFISLLIEFMVFWWICLVGWGSKFKQRPLLKVSCSWFKRLLARFICGPKGTHDRLTERTCIRWRKKRRPEQMTKGTEKTVLLMSLPPASFRLVWKWGIPPKQLFTTEHDDENTSKLGCPSFRQTLVWKPFQHDGVMF